MCETPGHVNVPGARAYDYWQEASKRGAVGVGVISNTACPLPAPRLRLASYLTPAQPPLGLHVDQLTSIIPIRLSPTPAAPRRGLVNSKLARRGDKSDAEATVIILAETAVLPAMKSVSRRRPACLPIVHLDCA